MAEEGAGPMATEHALDARGLTCPLPVLRARKAMKPLASGDRLRVEATDPAARQDFAAFCDATGDRLVSQSEADGVLTILIEKA